MHQRGRRGDDARGAQRGRGRKRQAMESRVAGADSGQRIADTPDGPGELEWRSQLVSAKLAKPSGPGEKTKLGGLLLLLQGRGVCAVCVCSYCSTWADGVQQGGVWWVWRWTGGPDGKRELEARRGAPKQNKVGSIDVHTGNQVLGAHVHTKNRCACYVYNNKERTSFDLRLWMVEAPPKKERKKERRRRRRRRRISASKYNATNTNNESW